MERTNRPSGDMARDPVDDSRLAGAAGSVLVRFTLQLYFHQFSPIVAQTRATTNDSDLSLILTMDGRPDDEGHGGSRLVGARCSACVRRKAKKEGFCKRSRAMRTVTFIPHCDAYMHNYCFVAFASWHETTRELADIMHLWRSEARKERRHRRELFLGAIRVVKQWMQQGWAARKEVERGLVNLKGAFRAWKRLAAWRQHIRTGRQGVLVSYIDELTAETMALTFIATHPAPRMILDEVD